MNKIILIGRLLADPEQKKIAVNNSEIKITEFNLVVNSSNKKEPLMIKCSKFGQYGDTILKYASKGDQIAVEGALEIKYLKNDEGKISKSFTQVLIDYVTFLGTKKSTTSQDDKEFITIDELKELQKLSR